MISVIYFYLLWIPLFSIYLLYILYFSWWTNEESGSYFLVGPAR